MVVPLVIGALGGDIRQIMVDMGRSFETNNLRNPENSIDGQWDYLEKGSLGIYSRDGWINDLT